MQRRRSAKIGIWLLAIRPQFLTISVLAVGVGTAIALPMQPGVNWINLGLALLAIVLIHASADALNDYYDFKSGADQLNQHPLVPFTGGSRVIQRSLLSPREMRALGWILMLAALVPALSLVARTGPALFWLGLTGIGLALAYSMTPFALVYRGLGELVIIIDFGVLPVLGSYYVQTGQLALVPAIIGLVPGLLTAAILYINQFPDHDADLACNKRTLVVQLGLHRAANWYFIWSLLASLILGGAVVLGWLPDYSLWALAPLPLAAIAAVILRRDFTSHESLASVIKTTIGVHNLCIALLIAAFCLPMA